MISNPRCGIRYTIPSNEPETIVPRRQNRTTSSIKEVTSG